MDGLLLEHQVLLCHCLIWSSPALEGLALSPLDREGDRDAVVYSAKVTKSWQSQIAVHMGLTPGPRQVHDVQGQMNFWIFLSVSWLLAQPLVSALRC
jgi:hypothetical protein